MSPRLPAFLLTSLLLAPVAAAATMGRVVLARGEVTLQRPGAAERLPLTVGSAVEVSDTLRTGPESLARLLLDDRSLVTLGANSEVALQALRDSESKRPTSLKVFVGRLWASVLTVVHGERVFEIDGPNAIAGVRGTAFAFEVSVGTTQITVARGTVRVADAAGVERDIVRGQRSVVSAAGQRIEEGVSDDDLSSLERSFAARTRLDPANAASRLAQLDVAAPARAPTVFAPSSVAVPLALEPKVTTRVRGRVSVR